MAYSKITRLHWKLYFPLVIMIWLIIGLTMVYFVNHEKQRQRENLENRLLNVNNTVIDAYDRGVDLQETVEFIRLFTDNTTLAPLRITVYDNNGKMVADNPAATIHLYHDDGTPDKGILELIDENNDRVVRDLVYENNVSMVSAKNSRDGKIHSLAALPYEGEVLDFLSYDPMVWIAIIILGVITSALAYLGVKAVCRNVYSLRDFANAIASDRLPENIDTWKFSNDELGEVSHNLLNLYRVKINAEQEKSHHERQICMNISHELNTPVSILKGYVDTLADDENMAPEMRQRFLERLKQTTDRLATLVTDISTLLRLDESDKRLVCAPIEMRPFLVRISDDVVQGHLADSMKLNVNIPEGCRVMGHESLLTNVLLNLIYNSAKYSEGTEISIDLAGEKDGMYVFTFADNGRGVEEKHLSRLFDLFYRVDYGRTRKSGGSGLGLPLVRRIINAMQGEISVKNAPEGGLMFTFTLPKAR